MKHEESHIQQTSVFWFTMQYPKKLLYAVPNGGFRNAFEASRMKKEGLLPGVPDICIAEPNSAFHGLYVEFKTSKGKHTENQLSVMAKLMERGYCVQTCRSFDDFKKVVCNYFGN